jgi:5-methylcytosine-specific restriction endonuclease McrA
MSRRCSWSDLSCSSVWREARGACPGPSAQRAQAQVSPQRRAALQLQVSPQRHDGAQLPGASLWWARTALRGSVIDHLHQRVGVSRWTRTDVNALRVSCLNEAATRSRTARGTLKPRVRKRLGCGFLLLRRAGQPAPVGSASIACARRRLRAASPVSVASVESNRAGFLNAQLDIGLSRVRDGWLTGCNRQCAMRVERSWIPQF